MASLVANKSRSFHTTNKCRSAGNTNRTAEPARLPTKAILLPSCGTETAMATTNTKENLSAIVDEILEQ